MSVARGHAHPRARADRARPQGRVSQGAARSAPRRLRAGQGRRQDARTGRGDRAQQDPSPHHRGGRRSPRDSSRDRKAAEPTRWKSRSSTVRTCSRSSGSTTQGAGESISASASPAWSAASPIRRSRRGCSPSTAPTAPAPTCSGVGSIDVLRSGAGGPERGPVAGRRGDRSVGGAKLHAAGAGGAGGALRTSASTRRGRTCRPRYARRSSAARATEEIEFTYQRGERRHGYSRPFEGVLEWLDQRYARPSRRASARCWRGT